MIFMYILLKIYLISKFNSNLTCIYIHKYINLNSLEDSTTMVMSQKIGKCFLN